jgi:endoglucanase
LNRRGFLAGLAATACARPSTAHETQPWAGINLAGLEFNARALPGREDRNYVAPRREQLGYYKERGFDLVRLPFRWERLQPELGEDFAEGHFQRIAGLVQEAQERDMRIILGAHQYGRRRQQGRNRIIGEGAEVTREHFAEFWGEMGRRFRAAPHVIFGLNNEPNDQRSDVLVDVQNGAIAALRDSGARQLVLASGNNWSGAHSWGRSNAEAMLDIVDPGDHLAFDVHQYLDSDSSGRAGVCVPGSGAARLRPFTNWAREHGRQGLLGEFGVGRNPGCREELRELLRHVHDHPGVWLGWAYWAGGPWWGEDYEFSLEPSENGGGDRDQMEYLRPFLR